MNVPNRLTILRVAMIPLFVIGAEKNKLSKKGNHAVEQIHKALYTKFPEIVENHTPLFCRVSMIKREILSVLFSDILKQKRKL